MIAGSAIIALMANTPHALNLRKCRISEIGRVYLVTAVTHVREPLFTHFTTARLVVNELRDCDRSDLCHTQAFVLMPDHLHWLLELRGGSLSSLVKRFKSRSGAAINRYRITPGQRVWQAGFYDHAMRRDEDLPALARYVVANPLRAGLVSSVRQYSHWDAIWI